MMILQQLGQILEEVVSKEAYTWLQNTLTKLQDSEVLESLLNRSFTSARRKLGDINIRPSIPYIVTPCGDMPISHWLAGDLGRIMLMSAALYWHPEKTKQFFAEFFKLSDEREKQAIILSLSLVDAKGDYKPYVVDSCRTNNLMLFSSIALHNPYAGHFFNEQEFNQLVIKSLFLDLNIAHIIFLKQRSNAELSRICEDYVVERIHANREIPATIWLALAPYAAQQGIDLLLKFITSDDTLQQKYCALALMGCLDDTLSGEKSSMLDKLQTILQIATTTELKTYLAKLSA